MRVEKGIKFGLIFLFIEVFIITRPSYCISSILRPPLENNSIAIEFREQLKAQEKQVLAQNHRQSGTYIQFRFEHLMSHMMCYSGCEAIVEFIDAFLREKVNPALISSNESWGLMKGHRVEKETSKGVVTAMEIETSIFGGGVGHKYYAIPETERWDKNLGIYIESGRKGYLIKVCSVEALEFAQVYKWPDILSKELINKVMEGTIMVKEGDIIREYIYLEPGVHHRLTYKIKTEEPLIQVETNIFGQPRTFNYRYFTFNGNETFDIIYNIERKFTVNSYKGIHMLPAEHIKELTKYIRDKLSITIKINEMCPASIMDMLMLSIKAGDSINVTVEGGFSKELCEKVLDLLCMLFEKDPFSLEQTYLPKKYFSMVDALLKGTGKLLLEQLNGSFVNRDKL